MDKNKLAEIGKQAERLGELKQHPSWRLLTDIFEAKRLRYFESVTKHAIQSGKLPDDFDYKRGFFAGAAYILAHPENAESMFEAALKKAERLQEEE